MELIDKYFDGLSDLQREQLSMLGNLYREWNDKINVVSRKDIDNLYERHILHALGLLKVVQFKKGSDILDLGTGGGIPGIPLAIMMPEVNFRLVDGRNKKIIVVNEIAQALDLKNVIGEHKRAEELKKVKFDFVVARGVTTVDKLLVWTRMLLKDNHINTLPNGLIAYKGGNLDRETQLLPRHEYYDIYPFKNHFEEAFFKEKYIMYVQG